MYSQFGFVPLFLLSIYFRNENIDFVQRKLIFFIEVLDESEFLSIKSDFWRKKTESYCFFLAPP
jgi:hypothetical protein